MKKPSNIARYAYPIIIFALVLMGAATVKDWVGGYGIIFSKDSTLSWRLDTMRHKQPGGPLRWFFDSNKVSLGGGRTYVRDAEALAGTIDSSGALYTLHYQLTNSGYGQGLISYSNGASDSALLPIGSSLSYLLLPDGYVQPERFVMLTDAPGSLTATFDALNSVMIGGDSTCLSFRIVTRGGAKYLTVWKHKLTDVPLVTPSATTAGKMVLQQQITCTFKASGTTTVIRWALWWNRRQR